MKFCKNCGYQINSENAICPNCNYRNNGKISDNVNLEERLYQDGHGPVELNTTGILVWSFINLLCCLPLGAAGIYFVFQARSAQSTRDAEKNLNIAKGVTIVGTVGGVIFALLRIFYYR